MLKKLINIFGNSLLFYADKDGNSVFRNYCMFKNTGCCYKMDLTKQQVGKILEYRIETDKTLNVIYILIPLLVYFIFIHMKFSLLTVLLCEFLWIFLAYITRLKASSLYSKYLNKNFGEYKLVEFSPHLNERQNKAVLSNFLSKFAVIIIALVVLSLPAFALRAGIRYSLKSEKPHTKIAFVMTKMYCAFYPKTPKIYDYDAYIKYMNHDIYGAYKDYKNVIELSGSNFHEEDYSRFANMLFLEKQLKSPAQALDSFNDYMTRKNMTPLEETKMLWIKSIFSIENKIEDYVVTDYDDTLLSLDEKDERNRFYLTCDKAYMLYLMNDYFQAIELYNQLIPKASSNKEYSSQLKSLYAERGFARRKTGDRIGADQDFISSGIPLDEINSYEPSYIAQSFIAGDF